MAGLLLTPASALAGAPSGGAAAPGGDLAVLPAALGGTATSPAAPGTSTGEIGPNTLEGPLGGARAGSVTLVRGALTPAAAGRSIVLELQDPRRGWTTVATTRAGGRGEFVATWRPLHVGRFRLRARAAGGRAAWAQPAASIEVFRSVIATWFGPGSYGSRTACGQTLTPQLVGVAHRTLPCGTMVDIAYGSQTISVPVVDRGPYAAGVSYDLTIAAAAALGVTDTARVGAVVVPAGAAAAP